MGLTLSQLPPELVDVVTWKLAVPVLATEMLCAAGGAPPLGWLKDNKAGDAAMVVAGCTMRRTRTV